MSQQRGRPHLNPENVVASPAVVGRRRNKRRTLGGLALITVIVLTIVGILIGHGGSRTIGSQTAEETTSPPYLAETKAEFLSGCEVVARVSARCECVLRHVEAGETEDEYQKQVIAELHAPASQAPPHAKEYAKDCVGE